YFEAESSIKGFFGFGQAFIDVGWGGSGESTCDQFPEGQADYGDAPCKNVDKGISEDGHVGRVNLTWKASDESIIYATWSQGYRPGGINRNPIIADYHSDFLTNWEAGWKSQWLDNTLQFNGAVFLEKWDDFQVAFAGDNGITQVNNGHSAEVKGTEMQLLWSATDKLILSAAAAYYDTELTEDYFDFDGNVVAPKGTPLPLTPDFKANVIARYTFELGGLDAHLQSAIVYEGSRSTDINVSFNDIKGDTPSYTSVDLSAGVEKDSYSVELYVKNATNADAPLFQIGECSPDTCVQNYGVRLQPRTIGIRFSQDF
ncbi:MAG: TonB-dependent receptor domain-containing protein, partial [Burkholderiales bacterium]